MRDLAIIFLWIVGIATIGVLLGSLIGMIKGGRQRSRTSSQVKQSHMRNLITACRGDKRQANRLIDYEIKRDRSITAAEAAKRAIDRLVRDRSGKHEKH